MPVGFVGKKLLTIKTCLSAGRAAKEVERHKEVEILHFVQDEKRDFQDEKKLIAIALWRITNSIYQVMYKLVTDKFLLSCLFSYI